MNWWMRQRPAVCWAIAMAASVFVLIGITSIAELWT